MVRLAVLAVLCAPAASAWAGADPDVKVERLTEHLGVEVRDAEAIVAILETARVETAQLKEQAQMQAKALQVAKEAGDVGAMRRAMKELQRIRRDHQDLRDDVRGDVFDRLTVEQQAAWTLFHLERRAQVARGVERVRQFQLQDAL